MLGYEEKLITALTHEVFLLELISSSGPLNGIRSMVPLRAAD